MKPQGNQQLGFKHKEQNGRIIVGGSHRGKTTAAVAARDQWPRSVVYSAYGKDTKLNLPFEPLRVPEEGEHIFCTGADPFPVIDAMLESGGLFILDEYVYMTLSSSLGKKRCDDEIAKRMYVRAHMSGGLYVIIHDPTNVSRLFRDSCSVCWFTPYDMLFRDIGTISRRPKTHALVRQIMCGERANERRPFVVTDTSSRSVWTCDIVGSRNRKLIFAPCAYFGSGSLFIRDGRRGNVGSVSVASVEQ